MSKAKDLREKSSQELNEMSSALTKELFQMKNKLNETKKLEKPHEMRAKRRERARVLTVLSEKTRAQK